MTDALDLIGHIYDAAFDAALWPDVLIRLADSVGGAQICMFDYARRTHSVALIAPRHDPYYVQAMRDEWMPREFEPSSSTYGRRLLGASAGQVLDARQLVPDGFFGTDFYNEWWRPQSLSVFGVGTKWLVEPDALGFCFVHGPSRAGGIKNAELFGVIAPHLARAAELHHRLWYLKLREASVLTGAGVTDNGVVFVDAALRVVHANDTAAELLRARDGLLVDRSGLATVDADASALLKRMIAGCVDRISIEGSAGGTLNVRRGDRLPLHILVAPVRTERWRDRETWLDVLYPVAILIVNDPERERQTRATYLRDAFGLTPAEAQVALEIAKGDGRAAAAARLAIAPGTVRIHLQRIFEKTGIHRQAELVGLLAEVRKGGGPPH